MRYGRIGFDFGDFEITKREILASVSIIAIMILIGFLISEKISESQIDRNEIYNKAVKIESQELFQYGMDTNIGNAFVYGELKALDTVTYPEIGGEFMSVSKVREEYTKHTRKVTKTREKKDGSTETYTEEEEYWTWDAVKRWSQHCEKVSFLGIEFDYGQVYEPEHSYLDTQKESSHVRYVYYGSKTEYTGTLFADLRNQTINNADFYEGIDITETVELLESTGVVVIFWIVWTCLVVAIVFGFYVLENRWLE